VRFPPRRAAVIGRLELDDVCALVDALPPERREAVVSRLPEGRRAELRKIELYPPHSAGRVMTTDFVALDAKMTAQEDRGGGGARRVPARRRRHGRQRRHDRLR
jgi:magnesium transporter